MRKFCKNICIFLLTTFVLFLSIGIHISKMGCLEDSRIFIGKEVPNCMQLEKTACIIELQKISCCNRDEIKQICCPEKKDDSCASETTNIQFDFETIISVFNFDFELLSVFLCIRDHKYVDYTIDNDYVSSVPPPKINKPELIEIQSFLL